MTTYDGNKLKCNLFTKTITLTFSNVYQGGPVWQPDHCKLSQICTICVDLKVEDESFLHLSNPISDDQSTCREQVGRVPYYLKRGWTTVEIRCWQRQTAANNLYTCIHYTYIHIENNSKIHNKFRAGTINR